MAGLAREGSRMDLVRNTAVQLTQGLRQKDFAGEAKRLFEFVQSKIRYVKDINGVETLHTADWMLRVRAGDCDDKSILLAALLLSIGHMPRFIAVGENSASYSHVWVQDLIGGLWVDLETTEPLQFGQRIPMGSMRGVLYKEV